MTVDYGPLLRKALARIDELEAAVARQREPIAVVGMACRLPGAPDPEAYWRLLAAGQSAIGPVPDGRWAVDGTFVDAGGFVGALREFDARFFGISGREAASVDPQQRLLLELAWEAFEDAGVPGRGVPVGTGVFVGVSNIDYREGMTREDDLDGYFSSGATPSTVSGRLAYFFGTRGPAVSVDTACSSSLVSVDMAVRRLRDGSCDLALAGGVNRMVTPHESRSLTKAGMLSPSGRCRPFDAAADGYVRAEGGGLVVLKRASDVTARDRVLGVILGTAVNQDGRSSGLTVPHGPSQQDVVRLALRDAGVEAGAVGYVEAHGTGTALGDPIELNALGAVFAGQAAPLPVGSVKSNIGHAESAAGIAGLIKALLMLQHRVIPPTLHLQELNPRVDWADLPIRVPTVAEPWQSDGRRVAGVSSFGFSGTNAHLVLAEAAQTTTPETVAAAQRASPETVAAAQRATPETVAAAQPVIPGTVAAGQTAMPGAAAAGQTTTDTAAGEGSWILPVSARDEQALRELVTAYRNALPESDLAGLVLTAAAGRSHLGRRVCAVGASAGELATGLERGRPVQAGTPKIAWLFTGQGAQRQGMTAELYASEPVFKEALDECAAVLDPLLPVHLAQLLFGTGEQIHETRFTQPALVSVEYALARLWEHWGVRPDYVLGHSVGEFTAACVAGVLSLPDALRLVAERGRLMQECPTGVMAAVRCAVERVEPLLAGLTLVSVAAVNGSESTVLAGDEAQLQPVLDALAADGVVHRRLTVSHAFHSPLLAGFAEPFAGFARRITHHTATLPLVSNLTGELVTTVDAGYWTEHALRPVQFLRGLRTLRAEGVDTLVELGPDPVLLGMAGQEWDEPRRLPSLRAGRERATMLDSLARLYEAGADVDWEAFHQHRSGRFVSAPAYPFQRERHWALSEAVPELLELAQVSWVDQPLPVGPARAFDGLAAGPLAQIYADGLSLRKEAHPAVTDVVFAAGADLADACVELLELAKALTSRAVPPRLVVLGRRSLWGLVRTIQAEHPQLETLAVDLVGEPDFKALAAEVTAPGGHRLVALEGGRRLVPQLIPLKVRSGSSASIGSVLITGGLGALGLRVAEALAAAGAQRLVLLGRHEPDAAAQAVLAKLGDVRVVQGDVAVEADLQRAVDLAVGEGGTLGGVVHAAGVLDDGPLREQTPARFAATLRAKVTGGALLDRLTRAHKPAFFVAFSSLAAVVPTRSSGAYGAANAYLDSLMATRRAEGLPGLSVNWGPWGRAGMAAGESAVHEAMGLRVIDPAAGTATLLALLAADDLPAQVVAAPADWAALRDALGDTVPAGLLDELASGGEPADTPAARQEPDGTPQVADRGQLRERVTAVVRDVLRVSGPIDEREGFFDMGFDSLTVLELRTRLQQELGVQLPATVAFKYPTVEQLLERLQSDLGIKEEPVEEAADRDADLDALLARVDRSYREIREP